MKLYTWLVDKLMLVFIGAFSAIVGIIIALYIHAILMEVIK